MFLNLMLISQVCFIKPYSSFLGKKNTRKYNMLQHFISNSDIEWLGSKEDIHLPKTNIYDMLTLIR